MQLENLNGQSITVHSFSVAHGDASLTITISCTTQNGTACEILFDGVSCLKLGEVSYPFQVCGFEILNYSAHGYSRDCRYLIHDYEDGKLSFFCENIEITEPME
ncbi:MAG: hypothetical protein E7594_07070 [Ruminococcaceae bacterium]|nr:hypothetical protein [Oscillospiraceae bacterium]